MFSYFHLFICSASSLSPFITACVFYVEGSLCKLSPPWCTCSTSWCLGDLARWDKKTSSARVVTEQRVHQVIGPPCPPISLSLVDSQRAPRLKRLTAGLARNMYASEVPPNSPMGKGDARTRPRIQVGLHKVNVTWFIVCLDYSSYNLRRALYRGFQQPFEWTLHDLPSSLRR